MLSKSFGMSSWSLINSLPLIVIRFFIKVDKAIKKDELALEKLGKAKEKELRLLAAYKPNMSIL